MSTAMPLPPDEPLLTPTEVAAYLKCSKDLVYKLRRKNQLRAVRVGSLFRFHPEDVRAYARGEAVVFPLPRRG
jgi:excisionase family DNA binding protein